MRAGLLGRAVARQAHQDEAPESPRVAGSPGQRQDSPERVASQDGALMLQPRPQQGRVQGVEVVVDRVVDLWPGRAAEPEQVGRVDSTVGLQDPGHPAPVAA